MIALDNTLRAARMIEAGRVTVTFKSPTGSHVTLTAKCRAPQPNGKWASCPLSEAKVIMIEVPNSEGWNDRVGKITRSKGFVADPSADAARVWCAQALLTFLAGGALPPSLEVMEEEACGKCGRALTDPESIARGIGPECYGQMTGSAHQKKAKRDDGKDKKNVPLAVGGWRERQKFLHERLTDNSGGKKPREEKPLGHTQLQDLPGETWEDIFMHAPIGKEVAA